MNSVALQTRFPVVIMALPWTVFGQPLHILTVLSFLAIWSQ